MYETVKQFIFKIKIISSVYLMQYVFNLSLKCLTGLVSGIPFSPILSSSEENLFNPWGITVKPGQAFPSLTN